MRVDGELYTCVVNTTAEHELYDIIAGAQQVVVERFQTAGRLSAPGLVTIELVGSIRGYCYAKDIPCTIQYPTDRWPFMYEANKAVGTIIKRSQWAKHEVDALAHLLAWEFRNA